MNHDQFPGSCGRCVRVRGTDSGASGDSFLVMIVDGEGLTRLSHLYARKLPCLPTTRLGPAVPGMRLPGDAGRRCCAACMPCMPVFQGRQLGPPAALQSAPSASMVTLTSPRPPWRRSPVSPPYTQLPALPASATNGMASCPACLRI